MSSNVTLLASLDPKVGCAESVRAILRGMVADTRAEPGNHQYDLYASNSEYGDISVHILERYQDHAALQDHRDSAHCQKYREDIVHLLRAPISVLLICPEDVG